jgi:hypothetical protein
MSTRFLAGFLTAAATAFAPLLHAQGYPSKPIRLVIGYAPGGYTLYYFDSGPFTVAPHMAKVGDHNLNSFTHLGHVCGSGSMLVVQAAVTLPQAPEGLAAVNKAE